MQYICNIFLFVTWLNFIFLTIILLLLKLINTLKILNKNNNFFYFDSIAY